MPPGRSSLAPRGRDCILAGHEPFLAVLASGDVRVTTLDGAVIAARADDGFISVEHDRVTIVSRVAELT